VSISVLVVDDQPLFCSGMQLLIDAQPDLTFAGSAHSGKQAIDQVRILRPSVVLMDLRMPDGNGLVATRAILRETATARILVLTTFRDRHVVAQALEAGASGFVTKDATPAELLQAVRDVAADRPVVRSNGAAQMLADPIASAAPPDLAVIATLTPREQEVFLHLARGSTNADIARSARISENTVRNHVASILQKLNLANRTEVAIFAHRTRLLPG
jgi:DNA-binding NarL/FixJ family response regulator